MRRGPRPPVDESPLPWRRKRGESESEAFGRFCRKYLRLSGGKVFDPRPWQLDLVASVWDPVPRPRLAAWALARGNAKSTLAAAMACYVLLTGGDDVSVDVVAVDQNQAGIVFGIAAKFIARHSELETRVQVYRERLVIPARGAELVCLPGSAPALEGRSPDFCVVDEGGRVDQEVYEVVALASGKKPTSLILLIGTPGPRPDNVLAQFRQHALDNPDDPSQVYREISAAQWPDHPTDCDDHGDGPGSGCLSAANPGLDDFLFRDALMALQPPKMSESHFRRARLVQWVSSTDDSALPPGLWESLSTGEIVPPGSKVVLSFDGSYSGTDATVLTVATVSRTPHIDVVQAWQRPDYSQTDWRVPILEVEQAIRNACQHWQVAEICADTYRWQRSLAVLQAEGLPIVEFPQTVSRMSAATAEFLTACRNDQLTHSGHPIMAEHIGNAVLTEDNRGGRMVKASRSRHAGRIDAAITAVMAYSRASWLATHPKKKNRAWSFPS
nr:terminase TerL endonuclease subunit [Mycobacterium sp. JS623]